MPSGYMARWAATQAVSTTAPRTPLGVARAWTSRATRTARLRAPVRSEAGRSASGSTGRGRTGFGRAGFGRVGRRAAGRDGRKAGRGAAEGVVTSPADSVVTTRSLHVQVAAGRTEKHRPPV